MISDNHTRELKYLEKLRKSQLSSWQVTPNSPVFVSNFWFGEPRKIALGLHHQPINLGKESKQLSVPWKNV